MKYNNAFNENAMKIQSMKMQIQYKQLLKSKSHQVQCKQDSIESHLT